MWLTEHRAKSLCRDHGIAVPDGELAATPAGAAAAARRLGCPVVVKAQVAISGRGKLGGVRRAADPEAADQAAASLLGTRMDGQPVEAVRVESYLDHGDEFYLSIGLDPTQATPVALVSAQGGAEIEDRAGAWPDLLARLAISPVDGLRPYHGWQLVTQARIPAPVRAGVVQVLQAMYTLYRDLDALLVEINPLAVRADGEVVALDAKILVDDNALYRQPTLAQERRLSSAERRAAQVGIHYVPLEGDIGIVGTGAGMAMANMDQVTHFGGRPANFMDIGPGILRGGARVALEILLERPDLKAVLFSGYTAGPLERVARDILAALAAHPQRALPVVVRLQGHQDAEARALLAGASDPRLHLEADFDIAARKAVQLAQSHTVPPWPS